MATITIPAETAAIELTVDGGDPFEHSHAVPSNTAALAFGTSGTFVRKIEIPADPVALAFSTSTGSDQVIVRELLAGAGIELQVWDRSDPKGTMLERLEFREQKFEWVLSDTGSIEIVLPRQYLNSVLAEEDHHIVVLVDGIERARFIAEDLVEVPVSEDERQSVKVVGRGIGASLEWGAVAPYDFGGPNQRVKRAWNNSTRALALYELFTEIQNRAILPDVIVDGWNGVYGSTGTVWPDLVDLEFDAGGSWLDLLQSWTEFGIEWLMTHDLRLQLAPSFGRQLADTVVLYPAHTVKNQELSISRRDIRTILFTQDGAGGVQRIDDTPARAEWGDREQYAVFSDALGAGTASANGYLLLDLIKDAVKERRVEIDPNAPGRRPFVDFDLGDVVGVWFGDDVYEFRVLAIAMGADDTGRIRCEVTLEYMLEAQRKRRLRLLNASTAGGGISSGPQTVYALGGGFTVTTSQLGVLPIQITAFLSTVGKLGFTLIGTASVAQVLTVDVIYGGNVLESFQYTIPAGINTIEVTWLWAQIPQGTVPMNLRVSTSTGTFTVADTKAQFWIEAKSIAGKQSVAPIMFVTQEVPEMAMIGVVETIEAPYESPMAGTPDDGELVDPFDDPTVVESLVDPSLLLRAVPAVNADDGWADTTTFTATGSTARAGNQTAVSGAFWRFPITVDFTGRTIRAAWLQAVTNAVASPVLLELSAVDAADPAAPTSLSEYNALTLTTERRDWSLTPTAGGTFISPSFKNIIDELLTSYGTIGHLVVLAKDDGTTLGRSADFRTLESGTPVMLVIEFE